MGWALLLLLALPAFAASPAQDLAAVRSEIAGIDEGAMDAQRSAAAFSGIWGRHVAEAIAARRRGESVAAGLSYDQRDRTFYEWRSRRNAEAAARRDYAWFKQDESEQRRLFGVEFEGRERGLTGTLSRLGAKDGRIRFRDWLLASEPEPEAVREALLRAKDLMDHGRREEAVGALKAMGPDAAFSPGAMLARALGGMAEGGLALPRDEWEGFYEALKARDPSGRRRELSWEMLCRAEQSRSGDWKFDQPYGVTSEGEWDAFVRALGVRSDDDSQAALRDFLKSHPAAASAAVKAARARPACGLVRVAVDGSGDALTISEGLERLKAFGGKGQLLVAPGRYQEEVVVSGSRVLVRAWPRGSATIAPPAGRVGLRVSGSEGVVLDGVNIETKGANALEVRSSRGVTVKHCALDAPAGYGIFSDGSPEVTVWDCAVRSSH